MWLIWFKNERVEIKHTSVTVFEEGRCHIVFCAHDRARDQPDQPPLHKLYAPLLSSVSSPSHRVLPDVCIFGPLPFDVTSGNVGFQLLPVSENEP